MKKLVLCLVMVLAVSAISSPVMAADKILIGLITKTNTNPFFCENARRGKGQGR